MPGASLQKSSLSRADDSFPIPYASLSISPIVNRPGSRRRVLALVLDTDRHSATSGVFMSHQRITTWASFAEYIHSLSNEVMLSYVVRNSELEPMDPASRLICDVIQAIAKQHNMTNAYIAGQIDRSPTYVSLRIRGLDAWDTRDINKLAKLFGYPNSFGLLDEVRGFGLSRSENKPK